MAMSMRRARRVEMGKGIPMKICLPTRVAMKRGEPSRTEIARKERVMGTVAVVPVLAFKSIKIHYEKVYSSARGLVFSSARLRASENLSNPILWKYLKYLEVLSSEDDKTQ
jgi:hypothetical protein